MSSPHRSLPNAASVASSMPLFGTLRGQEIHHLLAGIAIPHRASIVLRKRGRFDKSAPFTEKSHKLAHHGDVAWLEKKVEER